MPIGRAPRPPGAPRDRDANTKAAAAQLPERPLPSLHRRVRTRFVPVQAALHAVPPVLVRLAQFVLHVPEGLLRLPDDLVRLPLDLLRRVAGDLAVGVLDLTLDLLADPLDLVAVHG